MKDKSLTKEKILAEAKKEFLEKGYEQTSLRNICKSAQCTTGALYFFFDDKNDLFGALVQKQIDDLHSFMQGHFAEEMEEIKNIDEQFQKTSYEADYQITMQVFNYIYDNLDVFELLSTKAVGSKYENYVDDLIAYCHRHYRLLADSITKAKNIPTISDHMIHWIAHLNIEMFTQLIEHKIPYKEANELLQHMMDFVRNGWFGMFQENNNEKQE